MDRESSLNRLKKASEGKKLATSFFDFIEMNLYSRERYRPKIGMRFYMWSELKQEMQAYELHEAHQWYVLKEYVDNKIVYIDEY